MMTKIILFVGASLVIGLAKFVTVSLSKHKLGYREFIVSNKGREAELISAIICVVMWIGFFIYDLKTQTISIISPSIFSLLLGCMEGICISTLYTILMPRGVYEKGVLTETKVILYDEIGRHKTLSNKNKKYKKFTFPLIYSSNKKKSYVNLFVNEAEIDEVENALNKHKR